jgi:putative transposase
MAKPLLYNGQIYHVYNRGVDKRKIFLNLNDHQRFSDSLIVFNNTENLNGNRFADLLKCDERTTLVNIIAYCLMPNHFHLLLEQITDDGVAKFIQKMATSYTMYFNKKYQRNGALLQGTFKRSHIQSNSRLLEMSKYIHYNPYKILCTNDDPTIDTKKLLLQYPWSSFPDYANLRTESKIISNSKIILDQFDSPEHYVKYVLGLT